MFSIQDKQVLRKLAQRVHDIAQLPEQQIKRDMWRKHTALKHGIPPVFVSPEGSWVELIPPETLQCEDKFARQVELELRRRIYRHEHIPDKSHLRMAFSPGKRLCSHINIIDTCTCCLKNALWSKARTSMTVVLDRNRWMTFL